MEGVNNMKLIVGLGNPGKEYNNTRHNVGFMYLDYMFGDNFTLNKKFNAMEYETNINGEKILVIKPLSYMNLSGEVVIKYINYYKIDIHDILVIQDDLDMELGKTKLLFNHGDGGHNGIKDIMLKLSSKEFLRLKIGIGKPLMLETKDYVLGKFSSSDIVSINELFYKLRDVICDYVSMNYDSFVQKYNTKIHKE